MSQTSNYLVKEVLGFTKKKKDLAMGKWLQGAAHVMGIIKTTEKERNRKLNSTFVEENS